MLLEQEGIKTLPDSSLFDFSAAMPPPPLPPPSSKRTRARGSKPVGPGRGKDNKQMHSCEDSEKRLSEGTILELFEQLDPEEQRMTDAPAGDTSPLLGPHPQAGGSYVVNLSPSKPSEATTLCQLLPAVDVRLAEQSTNSKQSGDGTSPFNQLSPLHLCDFL